MELPRHLLPQHEEKCSFSFYPCVLMMCGKKMTFAHAITHICSRHPEIFYTTTGYHTKAVTVTRSDLEAR